MSVRGLHYNIHSTRAILGSIAGKETKRVICVWERNGCSHVEEGPNKFWDGTTEAVVVHVSAKTTQRIDLNQKEKLRKKGGGNELFLWSVWTTDAKSQIEGVEDMNTQENPGLWLRNVAILPNIDYIDFITQSMGSQNRLPSLNGTCMIACWPHTTHMIRRVVNFSMLCGMGPLNALLPNALQTDTSIQTTPLTKSCFM